RVGRRSAAGAPPQPAAPADDGWAGRCWAPAARAGPPRRDELARGGTGVAVAAPARRRSTLPCCARTGRTADRGIVEAPPPALPPGRPGGCTAVRPVDSPAPAIESRTAPRRRVAGS